MALKAFIRCMHYPHAQNKFNMVYSIWQKNPFSAYDILVAMATRLLSFCWGKASVYHHNPNL